MKLTFLGHATFTVEVAGKHLLFDPFIRPNPKALPGTFDSVKADLILLSHGHADHTADAVDLAKREKCPVLSNYEIAQWLGKQGVEQTIGVNLGGTVSLDFAKIKHVVALHSSELPDGTYGGNPGGFVVSTGEGNFYYSGDTALTYDMKLIAERSPLRFAVLCLGDYFTMGYEDALIAAEWLGVRDVVGVHFDTFPPITIDHGKAKAAFSAKGIRLHLLEPGSSVAF
jgi:L-ascorbate metabolism protein UlaG (beta-lactamase superfamily)